MNIPSTAPFSITAATEVVSAPGTGNYLHIVGIAFDNNETDPSYYTKVRLQDGSGGTDLYGGSNGSIYTPGKGGFFYLQRNYTYPYWDLSEDTGLYITPSNSRRISGLVLYYSDTTASRAPSHATFDISTSTEVISATASQTIKVIGLSVHNNGSSDEVVHLLDGSGGTDLYGGTTGALYLVNEGGQRQFQMNYDTALFELSTNTALYINPANGNQVSGCVWYIKS